MLPEAVKGCNIVNETKFDRKSSFEELSHVMDAISNNKQ